jgi:hypothetical protein
MPPKVAMRLLAVGLVMAATAGSMFGGGTSQRRAKPPFRCFTKAWSDSFTEEEPVYDPARKKITSGPAHDDTEVLFLFLQ